MGINRKKLMYAILREASDNKEINYTNEVFGVDEIVFKQVLVILKEEGLLTGIIVQNYDNQTRAFIIPGTLPQITLAGIEFLEENNTWKSVYKGLKELRDWLPL